jgi:hypothetical protein
VTRTAFFPGLSCTIRLIRPNQTEDLPGYREAVKLAIAALQHPMLDHKKAAALGGKATFKKFGRKEMSRRGKLGGRPPNKKAA